MKRILIVDSDMAVRGQIGRHARLEGYEVAEAGDGYTAVSMCRQNAFDIIILAILLPEMVLLCKQAAKNFHTICKKETALKRVLRNLLSAISFAQI